MAPILFIALVLNLLASICFHCPDKHAQIGHQFRALVIKNKSHYLVVVSAFLNWAIIQLVEIAPKFVRDINQLASGHGRRENQFEPIYWLNKIESSICQHAKTLRRRESNISYLLSS